LLLILGLALPWFAFPLQAGRSAWSLPVVLAGTPATSWVSYGAVLAACLGLGLVAITRSQGRPSVATAAVGAGVLVVSLTFVVATVTADWPLLQRLQDQTAQQAAIFGQFGYAVPGQQPSLMLLVPVTGTWALVGGALRLGLFSASAGGLVLFASGASSLAGWVRRARRRWMLLPALALLLVAAVLGRGAVAGYLAGQGAAASQAGNYQAASTSLAVARQLNPLLTSSTAYDRTLGQVLLATGGRGRPLALLAEADAHGAGGDTRARVIELRQAVARDPANPVLVQQLDQASQVLGLTGQDPSSLQALSDPTVADRYTEGRVLYALAEYPAALACFRRVLAMTGDANVTSSAFTYIALSELKLGQADQARRDLLRAVSMDAGYNNTLARSLIVGLYVSTKSGDA
jgi:tetratricopeptide (TPR) repeat protein